MDIFGRAAVILECQGHRTSTGLWLSICDYCLNSRQISTSRDREDRERQKPSTKINEAEYWNKE